jgi:transcriptional regulator with XRE-family HTH domain
MPDDYGKRIGRRIRRTRKNRGMTQTDLAQAMKVADAQISRWETGRVVPQRRNLEAIANALGVPAETFLLKDEDEEEEEGENELGELVSRAR